jgi:hypothetical protein
LQKLLQIKDGQETAGKHWEHVSALFIVTVPFLLAVWPRKNKATLVKGQNGGGRRVAGRE